MTYRSLVKLLGTIEAIVYNKHNDSVRYLFELDDAKTRRHLAVRT